LLYLSSSSLHSFLRCRKQYELSYIHGFEPKNKPVAMERGTGFHKCAEAHARLILTDHCDNQADNDMLPVWNAYLEHHHFPSTVMAAEEPVWTNLILGVRLRITPDLIYLKEGWIVCRDYKTFSKDTDWDVDLDFQGRLYIALLRKYYGTEKVRFEYVKVRSELGRQLKGKGFVQWSLAERYPPVIDLIPSKAECDVLLEEARYAAHELLTVTTNTKRTSGSMYRSPLRGFDYNSCDHCSVKEACKAQLGGEMDMDAMEIIYDYRKPLTEKVN
jgi:PD-(D/E)XK nuclease superfamily